MAVYSHSRLGTYETCPLQYQLRYLDKVEARRDTIEAFLGTRFHEVMERLYGEIALRVLSLEDLLAHYEARWEAEIHDGVEVHRKDRTAEDYRALGRRYIADYYARYRPFDQSRVLGLEKQIFIDLDPEGRYRVTGYIDRLTRTPDGVYEIHDYKTSAGLPPQADLDEDRQLGLYQMAVQTMWPEARTVRLIWHYVAFDQEMVSNRTPDQLARLRADVIALIREIESTREFEPHESALCDWCPYWAYCPLKKHLVRVAALAPEAFPSDDGVRIVDAYADAASRRKARQADVEAVEAEMEKIRAAAADYAAREGLEVIRGSAHKLKVKSVERIKAPAKGSEARAALDEALRGAGLWADLSVLDVFALEREIKAGRLDAALRERIEPRLTREKDVQVTLSKLKDEA